MTDSLLVRGREQCAVASEKSGSAACAATSTQGNRDCLTAGQGGLDASQRGTDSDCEIGVVRTSDDCLSVEEDTPCASDGAAIGEPCGGGSCIRVTDCGRPYSPRCLDSSDSFSGSDSDDDDDSPQVTYRLGKQVGKGNAVVYQAKVLSSTVSAAPRDSDVAVKVYSTKVWREAEFKIVNNEVKIMAVLKHPNIVRFYCSKHSGQDTGYGVKYDTYGNRVQPEFVIVQELCSRKDAFDNIYSHGEMEPALAAHFFRQLASAVEYLHCRRVAHRDIKLENLVFSQDWTLKVCDFGLALSWATDVVPRCTDSVGTQRYRSPEMNRLRRAGATGAGGAQGSPSKSPSKSPARTSGGSDDSSTSYDPRCPDVWACAVVLFEMLLGYPPLDCANSDDWFYAQIASSNWAMFWAQHKAWARKRSARCEATITPAMRSFFEFALVPDEQRRPTLAQLLQHEYLASAPTLSVDDVCRAMERRTLQQQR
jgi:serine/threonine protein kinase